ncbi:MAG: prephenate dehydrogenase [Haloglomus sp.]
MNLVVVGAGTMGRWFARSVAPVVDRVAFADEDAAAARAAVAAFEEQVAADEVDVSGNEVVAADDGGENRDGRRNGDGGENCDGGGNGDETVPTVAVDEGGPADVVCVAVPISAVPDAVAEHGPRAERALLDISGEMTTAVAALEAAAPDRERASFHPLFAPDNEPGNCAVVVDHGGPVVREIRGVLADRGNRVFDTTPEEHDRAMATVQARAHAAVLAFGLAADDVPEAFHTSVSGPLADLVADVTGGNSSVYAEIQDAFDGADAVADAARRIASAADDPEAFAALYETASNGPFGAAGDSAAADESRDDRDAEAGAGPRSDDRQGPGDAS